MNKEVNLEIYLKIFKSKDDISDDAIVCNDGKYYIVTGGVMSNKYECYVYYCRQLQTSSTKIFNKDQLEVVKFSADVFESGKCIGTYTIGNDSIEKIDYTTKPQKVRGYIATYKSKSNVGDTIIYPVNGIIHSIDSNINVLTDDSCIVEMFNRSHITLASKDTISTLKLVCPKCGR